MSKRTHQVGSGAIASALLAGWLALPGAAAAQNAAFQSFFTNVCMGSPTGSLATRCGETVGGNLSGDSEVSLNPSQGLAMNETALSRAFASVQEVQDHLETRRAEGHGDGWSDPASSGLDSGSRWSLLANGGWESIDRDASGRERGWDGDTWSAQFGADYAASDQLFVGGIVTLDWGDYEFDRDTPIGSPFSAPSNAGDTETEGYALTLFGSYNFSEELWADAHVGGAYTDYDFTRRATFQNSVRTTQTAVDAKADTDGGEVNAGLGGGYDGAWGAFSAGGYLRLNYVWTRVQSFREKDASGLEMRVSGEDQDSLVSIVGLRGSYAFSTPIGVVLPQVRAEYEHEYLRDRQTIKTRYLQDGAGRVYRVKGNSPDRDYANVGASIAMVLQGGWIPFVDYEVLLGDSYFDRHRVTAGFRKEL